MGEPRGSGTKWLWGCGIGCGLFLLLVAVLVAGAALFVRSRWHAAEQAILEELPGKAAEEYAKKKEAGLIQPEYQPLLDALLAFTQRDDVSPATLFMASMEMMVLMDDDKVDATDVALAEKVLKFLKANPSMGWFAMYQALAQDPDIQLLFQRMQMQQMENQIKQREEQKRNTNERIEGNPQEAEEGLEHEQEAAAPVAQQL